MWKRMKWLAVILLVGVQVGLCLVFGFTGLALPKPICLLLWCGCAAAANLLLGGTPIHQGGREKRPITG